LPSSSHHARDVPKFVGLFRSVRRPSREYRLTGVSRVGPEQTFAQEVLDCSEGPPGWSCSQFSPGASCFEDTRPGTEVLPQNPSANRSCSTPPGSGDGPIQAWSRSQNQEGTCAGLIPHCARGGGERTESSDHAEALLRNDLWASSLTVGEALRLRGAKDGIFGGFGDAKLHNSLRGDLNLLAGGGIAPDTGSAIHQDKLAETRQRESVLGLLIR
jgi:hypothetical protein